MITARQLKALERETNKILAKAYKNKTYAFVGDIKIDRDLELVQLTMRLGTYKEDGKTVEQQVEIVHYFTPDLYSIKQSAALCANEALEKMETL